MIVTHDARSREVLQAWYPKFRAAIPGDTETRELDTPFGRTHVLICGAPTGPPVVLLHGAMASSAHAVSEVAALLATHRVYAVDVLGQSVMSADARLPLDPPSVVRWAAAVFDGLGLSRAAVIGISWGGHLAMCTAAGLPERVQRLVLVVPAGLVASPAWPSLWNVALPLAIWRLTGREASLQAFLGAIFTGFDEAWAGWIRDAMVHYRQDFRAPPLSSPDSVRGWGGPTLVFGADKDLFFPGEALLARARALFPQAETELIADCRHSPPFTPAFRAWLAGRIGRFLAGEGG